MPRQLACFLAAALFLVGCSSDPVIDDSAELVKECHSLLATASSGAIDRGQWPSAVRKLNPVEVRSTHGSIVIITFRQTGKGVRGYIVAEKEPHMDRFQISATSYPDIYRFDFQP